MIVDMLCCAACPTKIWTGRLVRWVQETHCNYSKPIGEKATEAFSTEEQASAPDVPWEVELRRGLNSLQNGWSPTRNHLSKFNWVSTINDFDP